MRRTYGADRTIHRTGKLNIELDPVTGEVTCVWFRCMNLPFDTYSRENPCRENPDIMIDEIIYTERVP